MKVNLSTKEQAELQRELDSNLIRKWFQIRDSMKFEVGDVLVKKTKDYHGKWSVESINYENKMPQRYVFVHEDEFGIGYIKQLRVSDGKLGSEFICLLNFDYRNIQFIVDPEYAEHIILDADFDIKQLHKQSLEARKIAIKANRKLGKKMTKLSELNSFFESMKKGDKFYMSKDFTGKHYTENEFVAATQRSIALMDSSNTWDWRRFKEEKNLIDATYVINVDYKGKYGKEDRLVTSLAKTVLYKSQPAQEEKK